MKSCYAAALLTIGLAAGPAPACNGRVVFVTKELIAVEVFSSDFVSYFVPCKELQDGKRGSGPWAEHGIKLADLKPGDWVLVSCWTGADDVGHVDGFRYGDMSPEIKKQIEEWQKQVHDAREKECAAGRAGGGKTKPAKDKR